MVKKFTILVAINSNSLIGVKEYGCHTIPWNPIKQDMIYFKNKTSTVDEPGKVNAIIMGYNTWTTLPIIYKKIQTEKILLFVETQPVSHPHLMNCIHLHLKKLLIFQIVWKTYHIFL